MLPKKGYYIPRAREMDMVPSIWNNFSETTHGTEKWHGIRMKSYKVFFVNRNHIAVYKESEWKTVGQHELQKFLRQPSYFKKIWRENNKVAKQTGKLTLNILKKLKASSSEDLLKYLLSLKRQWIAFDQINILPWFLGSEPLREYLTNELLNKYKVKNEDMEILFTANKLTLTTAEELEVFKAALEYLKTGTLPTLSNKLSKNFGWIPFGYDGPTYWDSVFYANKVQKEAETKPQILKKKINSITAKIRTLIQNQKNLTKYYKLDVDLKRLLDIQQKLYVMTDERKKVHFNINYNYHKVLEALETPSTLTLHELKYLDAEEIIKMFKTKAFKKYKKLSASRQKTTVCGFTKNGKKEIIISGKQAEKMLTKHTYIPTQVNEITGMIANKIGTGITKGIVRKIINPREMSKMKKGEILVTWMTTPDFVPAMRKAKAIITNEGGITSHAAIVSRELGIPCIIGTKIATKIFKDGDRVEVDANKGIVRKI